MKNIYTFLAVLLTTVLTWGWVNAQQESQPLKILIITGGHDFEREAFFEMFKSFGQITYQEVQHPEANQYFQPEKASEFDVFVFYDMYQKISSAEKQHLLQLLDQGKGMVFLHHSLVSYNDWSEFEKIIGGKYHQKPYFRNGKEQPGSTYQHDVKVQVHIEGPSHPVVKNLKDFTLHDEVYGLFTVTDQVTPILSTNHPESSKFIGWENKYGQATIIYLQPGHDHHAYENENYRQLVRNAIHYVAGQNPTIN